MATSGRMTWAVLGILVILLALMGPSCGNKKKGPQRETTKTEQAAQEDSVKKAEKEDLIDAVPVRTTQATLGRISSYLPFPSAIETEEDVDVYSQVVGLVEQIHTEEGDYVQKGVVLARLDDDELRLSEANAKVNFNKLETGFQRVGEMYKRNLISQEEYENAKYELRQAEITWQKAKLSLKHSEIRAPIEGVISERLVKLGDRVSPSTQLFSIVNMGELIAKVFVPAKELQHLRAGQQALITSDFVPGEEFGGWIKRISPVVDPGSGTFKVTVGVQGKEDLLRPGMFVSVHIVTGTHDAVVLIPVEAVVYDGGVQYAFTVQDSVAVKVALDVGYVDRQRMEVCSGIEPGTKVIVVGQEGLKDKAKVRIISEKREGPIEEETERGRLKS